MRDLFFVELGKVSENIHHMEESNEGNLRLLEVIDEMIHLSNVGRKEGLLALEEASCRMDDSKKHLKMMILLIVDGTDPVLVEEICMMRYMANNYNPYQNLEYLMQMIGSLAIQQGENPRVIEEKLLAMVPESVMDMFRERSEAKIKSYYQQKTEDIDMSRVEKLYEGELNTEIVEMGYPELEKLDYLLKIIEDRSLQRGLREIENADLELAMKGLSGEGRRRAFINMSKRLCVMVAEDMGNIGRGRKVDIGDAAKKIYNIFMRLMDRCDIYPEESDEVYALYQEYRNSLDATEEDDEQERIENLSLDEIIRRLSEGSDDSIF